MKTEPSDVHVSRRILTAAYACISQKGYADASLRDIAQEAGVALSQLNYYYKNKEGLFEEVVRELSNQYLGKIELKLKAGGSPKESYDNLIRHFRTMMRDDPGVIRLLFDLISMSIWNEAFKRLLSDLFTQVSELVRRFIIEGSALKAREPSASAEALAKSIVSTLFGTAMQYILNPRDGTLFESLNCIEILF